MLRRLCRHGNLLAVAISALALGAGASAIATAGASPSHARSHFARAHHRARLVRALSRRSLLRRTVHAELVVATPDGFGTVTVDRGSLQGVSGQQLTVADGSRRATWKTVTLTIPTDAKVRNNGSASSLSSLQPGERVIVIQAPRRTWVLAHTAH